MFRSLLSAAFVALLLLTACNSDERMPTDPEVSQWLNVLQAKKDFMASKSDQSRQLYADALRGFVDEHPDHKRARDAYDALQVDFANELVSIGRYDDAIAFYNSVLQRDATNLDAKEGLSRAVDLRSIRREKFEELHKGMTCEQVAAVLGRPLPGWTRQVQRDGSRTESWYYRRAGGGVAGVYFSDGKLFTAEFETTMKLADFPG